MDKVTVNDIPLKFFNFTNKYGDKIRFGSTVYYPIISTQNKNVSICKSKVECFAFVRGKAKEEIKPMILTRAYLLDLDDVRKSYDEAEEVVRRWEEKIVNSIKETIQF